MYKIFGHIGVFYALDIRL